MKETFEKRKLTGNIKIKLEDGSYWETDKYGLVRNIIKIVGDLNNKGYKLTLRQLYYQLVSKDLIPNRDVVYKKLGRVLDDCRYGGHVDWDAIEDRGRIPFLPYWVSGIKDAIRDTINQYRLNRQKDQPVHVEMWTEKDAISGILKRAIYPYHIRLMINKGYSSSTAMYQAYNRFLDIINQGRKVVVIYFGDHDPSGCDMVRDIQERIKDFLCKGSRIDIPPDINIDQFIKDGFEIKRIGLTLEQVKTYNLPPNPAKITDPRAKGYIQKYGKLSWEVDALSPDVLIQIVSESIESIIDMSKYEDICSKEMSDKITLKEMIKEQLTSVFNDPDLWGTWECPECGEISNDPESVRATQCPNKHSVFLSDVVKGKRKAYLREE